jgi:hypothetical protein
MGKKNGKISAPPGAVFVDWLIGRGGGEGDNLIAHDLDNGRSGKGRYMDHDIYNVMDI